MSPKRAPRLPDPPPPEGGPPGLAGDPPHPHAIVTELAIVTDLAKVAPEPSGDWPPGPP